MSKPKFRLVEEILRRSVADSWDEAVEEWSLVHVCRAEESQECACGHFPIIRICTIRNWRNGDEVEVGSCCVQRFVDPDTEKVFAAINRISKDSRKAVNEATIAMALANGVITDWEAGFYRNTMRKRNMTRRMWRKRKQINLKILAAMEECYV